MSQGVHPDMEVGDIDPHGLFTHSRLVRVPGRLGRKGKSVSVEGYSCLFLERGTFLLRS